jgi:HSP20 family protein
MANSTRSNSSTEQRSNTNQNQSRNQSQQMARREGRGANLARPLSSTGWLIGSPFDLIRRFSDEMQGFFGHSATWEPNVEVFQRGSDLVVRADLPGLTKDDVIVDVADDVITIRGERREQHEEEHDGFYRTERTYGTFYRVIPLPEGALAETAKATFNNGVLEVVVQAPPRDVSRGRRIEVRDAKSNQQEGAPQGQQQGKQQPQQQAETRQ